MFSLLGLFLQSDESKEEEKQAALDQLNAEAKEVLVGGQSEVYQKLESLLESGEDQKIASFIDQIGVGGGQFNNEIAEAIGNIEVSDTTLHTTNVAKLNETDQYDVNSTLELLGDSEGEALVNILLLEYIINRFVDDNILDLEDWLKSTAGQQASEDLLNKILENKTGRFTPGSFSRELSTGDAAAFEISDALNKAAGNVPDDPEDEEANAEDISDGTALQCLLLQLLNPLSKFYDDQLERVLYDGEGSLVDLPYSGRIVKLNCDEPSNFVNYVSMVEGVGTSFTNIRKSSDDDILLESLTPQNDYRLSFIKEHGGELYELPIFYNGENFDHTIIGNNSENNTSPATPVADTAYGTTRPTPTTSSEPAATVLRPSNIGFVDNEFTDLSIDVTYAGSNPATYRNDVEVTISLASNALQNYLQNWTYPGLKDDPSQQDIKFNLFDLILFPNLEKNSEGYGRVFKSQFSPSYNRIRLAYISDVIKGSSESVFYSKNCNVLDLTPIDHELKRDEEGKSYILTITYRGYVQSVMTSPETDALSNEAIKLKREERDFLLQAAVEKGCSLRELQKIQTELNTLAQADIQDVSTDMLTSLFLRHTDPKTAGLGIYKLNVDGNVKNNLKKGDKVSLQSLKKRLVSSNRGFLTDEVDSGTVLATGAVGVVSSLVETKGNDTEVYFFYLADLLDTILIQSGLFENKVGFNDPTNPKRMKQQLRFLLGPFRDPEGRIINIGNIPISVDFFKEWYEENITAKELYIYPCLAFIRDMAERVVTNLLNEVCFEGIDDTKLIVRSSFFTGVKTANGGDRIIDAARTKRAIKPLDIDTTTQLTDNLPMVQVGFKNNIVDYINYCVVSTRQNRDQLKVNAVKAEIPEFVLEGNYIGCQKANFSRNTQTGLRESRFFRGSNSGITMLASVYNVTLTLDRPIHVFYPNQFIKITISSGGQFIKVGDVEKSVFTELGIDGYYVITKVKTSLSPRDGVDQTILEALWVSSFDPYHTTRGTSSGTANITDPTEEAKNNLCNAYVRYAKEISIDEALPDSRTIKEGIDAVEDTYPIPPPEDQETSTNNTLGAGSGQPGTLTEEQLEAQFEAEYASQEAAQEAAQRADEAARAAREAAREASIIRPYGYDN